MNNEGTKFIKIWTKALYFDFIIRRFDIKIIHNKYYYKHVESDGYIQVRQEWPLYKILQDFGNGR